MEKVFSKALKTAAVKPYGARGALHLGKAHVADPKKRVRCALLL